MKLSEAIRKGAAITRPTHEIGITAWLTESNGICYACVIGAAFAGICGASFKKFVTLVESHHPKTSEAFKILFGLTEEQFNRIHDAYEHDGQTREEIADWIEREYEAKLPQKKRESDKDYTKRVLAEIERTISEKQIG